jgi:hypothetical protein
VCVCERESVCASVCVCVCVSVRVRAKIMREREIKSEKCMIERETKIGREGNSVCVRQGCHLAFLKAKSAQLGLF